jgi:hypothetical protein
MKIWKWVVTVGFLATGTGCSGDDKVNIGDGQQTPPATLGAKLVDYSGKWDGYVEAFRFTDDTDRVRVTIDENGSGTVTAGDDVMLRGLDADAYPPAWTTNDDGGLPRPGPAIMVPGLAYELTKVAVQSLRIQLETSTLEAFRDWCELQSPALVNEAENLYACLPPGGTSFDGSACYLVTTEPTPIGCGRLACTYVCRCTGAGCSILSSGEGPGDIQLDAALGNDGNSLVGTMVLPGNPLTRTTVHLTRQ